MSVTMDGVSQAFAAPSIIETVGVVELMERIGGAVRKIF